MSIEMNALGGVNRQGAELGLVLTITAQVRIRHHVTIGRI